MVRHNSLTSGVKMHNSLTSGAKMHNSLTSGAKMHNSLTSGAKMHNSLTSGAKIFAVTTQSTSLVYFNTLLETIYLPFLHQNGGYPNVSKIPAMTYITIHAILYTLVNQESTTGKPGFNC